MNSSSTETSVKEIRKFGLIAFIFFGILCTLGIWRQKAVPIYLFGFLSLLGMGFILLPSIFKPVYIGWLKIAHLIGRFINAVILIFAYYLVITPSALLKRLFSGRPLPMKPDKEVSSYWVTRPEQAQPKWRFIKRY
ncbi:MAG: hypothetical protein SV375_03700 [Thermodesulfobacteriota bacterium]|nr:hypothetical protein [Thermodesulfobacteriota bacterium]